MKQFNLVTLIATCLCFSFLSCKDKVEFTAISDRLVDSLSISSTNEIGDTIPKSISQPAAKGLQWKAWEKWFKNCPKNETFKKNIVYLGAASSKGLGYIMSNDRSINRWDFLKVSKDTDAHKLFFDRGVEVTQCDMSQMNDFTFDMLIDGNVLKSVNADLGAFIQNARNVNIKAGKWRIESIETGPFIQYLQSSTDPNIQNYYKSLFENKNIVLTKILKISGFEVEIEGQDSINANLNANLENGFKVNVIPQDSTKNIEFNLEFKKTASNKIKVVSTGECSLFAQASKARKL